MSVSRRPDRTFPSHSHASHAAPLSQQQQHSQNHSQKQQRETPSSSPSPTHYHHHHHGRRLRRRSSSTTTTSHQSQTPPSPPPPSNSMDEDDDVPTPTLTPAAGSTRPTLAFPIREDCWSEDATFTLIEAWGDRYVDLNRGNLRQKHWQEVADAVNARHGHVKKARRTDIQCKNRIDTLKKRYKIEKSKFSESNGNYISTWPFFPLLDSLIGPTFKTSGTPMPMPAPTPTPTHHRKMTPTRSPLLPPSWVPVGPRSKRPASEPSPVPAPEDPSYFRRNFSAMAAAAAAVEAEEKSDTSRSRGGGPRRQRGSEQDLVEVEAFRQLAEAIGSFGEIYERVEVAKQMQMIELEKQRMQFAKDLELQRMKLFMESQVHFEKMKRSKQTSEPELQTATGNIFMTLYENFDAYGGLELLLFFPFESSGRISIDAMAADTLKVSADLFGRRYR